MNKTRYFIKDIGTDFGDAPFGSSLKSKDYTLHGIPVIQGQNIVDQVFEWNRPLYTSEEKFKSLKRSHCNAGDLVFPKIGNRTVGSCAIAKPIEGHSTFLLSTNMMKMSVNPKLAELKFVYYYFCQSHIRQKIISEAGGGAQPIFNFTNLKNFEIELPELPIQRRVAVILSAYDDLIENNTRRIRILEQMAQAIYQESFGKVEKESLPKGWKTGKLSDLVSLVRNTTNAGHHLENIPYVPIDIIPRHSLALTESKPGSEAQSSLMLFNKDDVLFGAMRSYFHKVVVAPFDGVTRSTCFVLRPKSTYCYSFAVMTLFQDSTVAYSHAHARGSTMPYAVWDGSLSELPVNIPPQDKAIEFNNIIKPILETIQSSYFRQNNLRQTRDLLLPRLVSGEFSVNGL